MENPSLVPASWVKKRPTFYLEDQNRPYLVLYLDPEEDILLKHPEDWTHLFHQTGGYACSHLYLHAKFLPITDHLLRFFEKLTQDYLDSCLNSPPLFADALAYQTRLQSVGLHANSSYHLLQEGFYPLDLKCLPNLSSEKLPENLEELREKDPHKKFQLRAFWGCAVLGPNCD